MRALGMLRAHMAYLSALQAAQRLGVGIATIYNRIDDGSLLAVNVGTPKRPKWRIEESELARFIAARSSAPPEEEA